jgi:hypothetical protein
MQAHIAAMLQKKKIIKPPAPVQEPLPAPVQEPLPAPVPEPLPAPVPEPLPAPVPEPLPAPVPEPLPAPVPEPLPAPVPEPVQETTPEPLPEPAPEPLPASVPEPVQEPTPEPVQEPAPTNLNINAPTSPSNKVVPKMIFIVPYRDRPQHLHFFKEQMGKVLSNIPKTDYKIYILHQQDERKFNRGAMKNIGFIVVKKLYPNDYKNITLVFNDVDTMPYTKNFLKYDTAPGIVKHFYGHQFALGGIVSITAGDFEKSGGFPNFWAWGYEDNTLKLRVDKVGLKIDYNQFYPIKDGNILQLSDGDIRNVSRTEFDVYKSNTADGFADIRDLTYNIDEVSGFVNVTAFEPKVPDDSIVTKPHSVTNVITGNTPFIGRRRPAFGRMI